MFLDNSYAIIYIMEPTDRSNVGNSLGGQNLPPVNTAPQPTPTAQPVQQPGYDPIFSPTGRADVQSASTTPTIISGPATPAPDPNHTASTATGDIVLQKSPAPSQTKSKLPLIIAAIAAILVVGAGIFILVANPFANNSNNSTNTSTVASFNKFINYLYDGSTATGYNADAYVDNASYKFEEMLNSNDQATRTEYFNVAQGLLNDASFPESQTIRELAAQIRTDLEFLKNLASIKELTNEEIVAYYFKHTPQQTKQYVQSHYATLSSSSHTLTQQYAQGVSAYQSWLVDFLAYLSNNGCINKENIDAACVEAHPLSAESATTRDNINATYADVSSARYVVTARLVNSVQELANNLNTEDNS